MLGIQQSRNSAILWTYPYWTFAVLLLAAYTGFQKAQGLVLHCLAVFIAVHSYKMLIAFNQLFHTPSEF